MLSILQALQTQKKYTDLISIKDISVQFYIIFLAVTSSSALWEKTWADLFRIFSLTTPFWEGFLGFSLGRNPGISLGSPFGKCSLGDFGGDVKRPKKKNAPPR